MHFDRGAWGGAMGEKEKLNIYKETTWLNERNDKDTDTNVAFFMSICLTTDSPNVS